MEYGITLTGESGRFEVRTGQMEQVGITLRAGARQSPAPASYSGMVVEHEKGSPLAGAAVTLRSGPFVYRCSTGEDGRFEVVLPESWNAVSIEISKKGYRTRYIGTHILESGEVFCIY